METMMGKPIAVKSPVRWIDADTCIRRAVPGDIEGVAALGIEALEKNGYEELVIDPKKVLEMARLVVTGAGNYCLVASRQGKIVGAVSALVQEQLFYERKVANVVQFYCTAPGVGVQLLREFLSWVRGRPAIKSVMFCLEIHADPRVAKLLRLLGMQNEFPVMAKFY